MKAIHKTAMRVAFWSNYPHSGVTTNMITVGAAMSLLYNTRIILTSNHFGKGDLWRSISGNEYNGLIKEAGLHYGLYDNGLDLFERGNGDGFFLRKLIDSSKRFYPTENSIRGKGLYCHFRERSYTDSLHELNLDNSFGKLADSLEKQGDHVFMDLQSQGSLCTLSELERADIIAVNLKQDKDAVRNFFKCYESITGKCIFLISSYSEKGAYLKRDLIRDHHIHPERVAVIPYDPGLVSGFADGRIIPYICTYFDCGKKHSEYRRMWYIRYAAGILMRTLANGAYGLSPDNANAAS